MRTIVTVEENDNTVHLDFKVWQAYKKVTTIFIVASILALSYLEKEFQLFSVVAILGKSITTIVCGSRTLKFVKQNYLITERKYMALVCALETSRFYFMGKTSYYVLPNLFSPDHLKKSTQKCSDGP